MEVNETKHCDINSKNQEILEKFINLCKILGVEGAQSDIKGSSNEEIDFLLFDFCSKIRLSIEATKGQISAIHKLNSTSITSITNFTNLNPDAPEFIYKKKPVSESKPISVEEGSSYVLFPEEKDSRNWNFDLNLKLTKNLEQSNCCTNIKTTLSPTENSANNVKESGDSKGTPKTLEDKENVQNLILKKLENLTFSETVKTCIESVTHSDRIKQRGNVIIEPPKELNKVVNPPKKELSNLKEKYPSNHNCILDMLRKRIPETVRNMKVSDSKTSSTKTSRSRVVQKSSVIDEKSKEKKLEIYIPPTIDCKDIKSELKLKKI